MLESKIARGMPTGPRIVVAGSRLASWTQTHTIFVLHYAHLCYGDDPTRRGLQDCGG